MQSNIYPPETTNSDKIIHRNREHNSHLNGGSEGFTNERYAFE